MQLSIYYRLGFGTIECKWFTWSVSCRACNANRPGAAACSASRCPARGSDRATSSGVAKAAALYWQFSTPIAFESSDRGRATVAPTATATPRWPAHRNRSAPAASRPLRASVPGLASGPGPGLFANFGLLCCDSCTCGRTAIPTAAWPMRTPQH